VSALSIAVPADRRKRIFALALPIIGGMVSQNVLNLVDTAMVGVLGDEALAAVGTGGFLNFLASAFILGLGAGVQAVSARRVGEGRDSETAIPLNGGILVALGVGVPWSLALFLIVPFVFPWIVDDPAVVEAGVPYLQARVLALTAMAMNFSFRGFWNATDRPGLYMRTLFVMHGVNISLNWVLIYGNLGAPALGAHGAGVASAIATWVGVAYYFLLGVKHARPNGFLRGRPDALTMRSIVKLSVPAGLGQTFFSGGLVALFWIVGQVGTPELAAATVLINLTLVALLPGLGFGLASMSFVGQALGRKDVGDARRWGWDVVKVAIVTVTLIALPGVLLPRLLLSIFIYEPSTLELAVWPLRIVALFIGFDSAGMVLMNSLQGAGDSTRVMMVTTVLQWMLFLPAAFVIGPILGYGLTGIWIANVCYRALQTLVFAAYWKGDRWAHINV
jgi:putative MATE family efflux protein